MDIGRVTASLVDELRAPALIVRPDLAIVHANRAFSHLVGVDRRRLHRAGPCTGFFDTECGPLDERTLTRVGSQQKAHHIPNATCNGSGEESTRCMLELVPLSVAQPGCDLVLIVCLSLGECGNEKGSGGRSPGSKDDRPASEAEKNRLQRLLKKRTGELARSRRKLESVLSSLDEEMEIARNVQEGLIPERLPDTINLDTFGVYMPAGKVGGDLYDIITTRNQKVALLIFDVAGHGVPASLVAAMAKMLFNQRIEKYESPSRIFAEVHRQVCRFIHTGHYLTAFLGILDPVLNILTYARAGHVRPFLYRAVSGEVEELEGKGTFIGHVALADRASFLEQTIELETNDKLLLYTDGLTEALNHQMKMYGGKRLKSVLQEHGGENPRECVADIVEDLTRFRGGKPLQDDYTVLCVQVGDPQKVLADTGFTRRDRPRILVLRTFDEIEGVSAILLGEMDRKGYPDQQIRRTKLCIHELCLNALTHGNRDDSRKRVVVLYKLTGSKLTVSVVDQGRGFDHRHLPDPLAEDNLLKETGRGLFIVKKYTDRLRFNETGNCVTIEIFHGM